MYDNALMSSGHIQTCYQCGHSDNIYDDNTELSETDDDNSENSDDDDPIMTRTYSFDRNILVGFLWNTMTKIN